MEFHHHVLHSKPSQKAGLIDKREMQVNSKKACNLPAGTNQKHAFNTRMG